MNLLGKCGFVAAVVALCLTTTAYTHGAGGSEPQANSVTQAVDTVWHRALRHAIDPEDHECGPTAFDAWIGGKIDEMGFDVLLELLDLGALDFATYYSLLLDYDASDDYMGVDGARTLEMLKQHKDNQRFWDTPNSDILIMGMHGENLADDDILVPTVFWTYLFTRGVVLTESEAQEIADDTQELIESTIGYDHPFLTLNAFAFSAEGIDYLGNGMVIPDKIVMGDGIIEALEDMGLGDDGPTFVHAHEFAHHVQFELGAFGPPTPEETRRTELMADAFGAYYLAHARGGAFQLRRIVDAYAAAYVVGDCQFDSPGHHGTPNQRDRASRWGAGVATAARKQGFILSGETMLDLFEAELPNIVAPDAE